MSTSTLPVLKMPVGTVIRTIPAGTIINLGNPVRARKFDCQHVQILPHPDGILIVILRMHEGAKTEQWVNGNRLLPEDEPIPEPVQIAKQSPTKIGDSMCFQVLGHVIPPEVRFTVAYEHAWGAMLLDEIGKDVTMVIDPAQSVLCTES